ncbi:MAG TPA: hypothetical protein VGO37_22050 [Steroidobacteraceae bacterium]|jgi:hypothetical protein|nr:hypothetical protein [Steroidobacteraceae bacterium]
MSRIIVSALTPTQSFHRFFQVETAICKRIAAAIILASFWLAAAPGLASDQLPPPPSATSTPPGDTVPAAGHQGR